LILPEEINYIAVEGVIGSGKTTLARILADRLKSDLIEEVVDENPFLAQFYQDPRSYAFQTQIFFLLSRFKQLDKNLLQQDLFRPVTLCDYTLDKDKIFAHLNLNEDELGMYETVANSLTKDTLKPNFIIYLQASVDVLLQRINKRGREIEDNMSGDYLKSLCNLYDQHFFNYTDCPVLIVNTDQIDFVENPKDLAALINTIEEFPTGISFYNPQSL
jgi:deoxyguanosine kinase